jgi:hypothetical protein
VGDRKAPGGPPNGGLGDAHGLGRESRYEEDAVMRRVRLALAVLACGGTVLGAVAVVPPGVTEYTKMCNASAAVAVGDGLFVVADDEDKAPTSLRLYRVGQGGGPLAEAPIPENILDLDPGKDAEVDISRAPPRSVIASTGSDRTARARTPRSGPIVVASSPPGCTSKGTDWRSSESASPTST